MRNSVSCSVPFMAARMIPVAVARLLNERLRQPDPARVPSVAQERRDDVLAGFDVSAK
jgi:hypothetical protein